MAGLKTVAEKADVPIITAYQVLGRTAPVDEQTRQVVMKAAADLGYKLNITIHDVAHAAGVSIATVSYVLNDSAPVSEATRERVLEAVTALGYRPNSTARNLKASETRLIGSAWYSHKPGYTSAFLDRFTYWMAQAVESYGYHVLTFVQPAKNPLKTYDELIHTNRVDGFILSNTSRDDPVIGHLIDAGIPVAAFGRANRDWEFPYVDVDGRMGIEQAVEHLLLMGHTRIAWVGWPEGSLSGDERFKGYLDAMRDANIEPLPEWIVRTLNTPSHGYHVVQNLVKLPAAWRPTAIVCVSDMLALGVINSLEDSGIKVGANMAVTGFDDDPTSEFLRPPLTSLRQPIDLIAAKVVELVMNEITHTPVAQRQVLLVPTLMVRASSNRPIIDHA